MKRSIILYSFMIVLIAILAILIPIQSDIFFLVKFSPKLHFIIEILNSILMFSIFFVSKNLYSKNKDERLLILAGGFLICSIFNLVHMFTVTTFPYDTLSLENIQKNPSLIYLLFCNLGIPSSIYFALIYKPKSTNQDNIKSKFYRNYAYLFLILTIFPLLIYYLLPNLLYNSYVIIHSLEFVNYALFLMLAAMLINLKCCHKQPIFNFFIVGLLFMGLGGLFYINPSLIQRNGIMAHAFEFLGLFCLFRGVKDFQPIVTLFRFKDELVVNLSLLLIFFYVAFVAIASSLFKVIFPQYSGYVFIEFLLLFQLIIYIVSEISWSKIYKVYVAEERSRALIRIYESMRRVSNSNILKNSIIDEINADFKPDKCFIAKYDREKNSFEYDEYSKYLPSKTLYNHDDLNDDAIEFKKFKDEFNNIEVNFSNIDDYISKCSLQGTPQEKLLRDYNIKSIYSFPIKYDNQLLGYLILQYRNEYKGFNEDDYSFIKKIVTQIGITMKQ